jgi:hypothetical protein
VLLENTPINLVSPSALIARRALPLLILAPLYAILVQLVAIPTSKARPTALCVLPANTSRTRTNKVALSAWSVLLQMSAVVVRVPTARLVDSETRRKLLLVTCAVLVRTKTLKASSNATFALKVPTIAS